MTKGRLEAFSDGVFAIIITIMVLDQLYLELFLDFRRPISFITFRPAFTSFLTNVIGIGLPVGKLTMAFVVA
jgi:Endosomal/lysosomal potassium channel TMEM175